jgi:hypothetical protein
MGLQSITSIANPAVNGWARENLIELRNVQTPPVCDLTDESSKTEVTATMCKHLCKIEILAIA